MRWILCEQTVIWEHPWKQQEQLGDEIKGLKEFLKLEQQTYQFDINHLKLKITDLLKNAALFMTTKQKKKN